VGKTKDNKVRDEAVETHTFEMPSHEAFSYHSFDRSSRLELVHKYRLQRVPVRQIAVILGISTSSVYRDLQAISDRMRKEVQSLDSDYFIGSTINYYNEISAIALSLATDEQNSDSVMLSGLETSLIAKSELHKFLQSVGVFDALKIQRVNKDASKTDMEKLIELTQIILEE